MPFGTVRSLPPIRLDVVPSRSWYVAFYRELEQLISLTPAADPGSAVAYFRDVQDHLRRLAVRRLLR